MGVPSSAPPSFLLLLRERPRFPQEVYVLGCPSLGLQGQAPCRDAGGGLAVPMRMGGTF